jgi:NAD(P)-dependent dehydrogenase (short-subunit alcohol dehydrogenase family)
MSFKGLNVLVTGSSTGLGAATARQMAADGARVIVNYSSSEAEAQKTAQACRDAGAAEVLVVQGDVSNDADCARLAAAAQPWGSLNVLVNNAGTTKHVPDHSQLDQLSAEDFQRIYGVNVVGSFQMIRAARALLEAGAAATGRPSSVVNVSSVAGISGVGSSVAYAASKGALNTMTISLGRALAPSIRVNAVCPGFIDTPWFAKGRGEDVLDAMRVAVADATPLKVASTAEDIAQAVAFLASPASGHMTGEIVRMDAGSHLGARPARA